MYQISEGTWIQMLYPVLLSRAGKTASCAGKSFEMHFENFTLEGLPVNEWWACVRGNVSVQLLLDFLRHLASCAIGVLVLYGILYGLPRSNYSVCTVVQLKCVTPNAQAMRYIQTGTVLYSVTKVTVTKCTMQLKRWLRRLTAKVCNRRSTYKAWFFTFILLYFSSGPLLLAVGADTKPLPASEVLTVERTTIGSS